MTKDNRFHHTAEDGFTLVEVMVAAALLAIMAIYTVSAISTFGEIRRVEAQLSERQSVAAVQRHFIQTISNARVSIEGGREGNTKLNFSGEPGNLALVSGLNDSLARGGLQRLRYWFDATNKKLLLTYDVLREGVADEPGNEVELLSNVEDFQLYYYGRNTDSEQPGWNQTWHWDHVLPAAIKILVKFENRDGRTWEPLVVRIEGSI